MLVKQQVKRFCRVFQRSPAKAVITTEWQTQGLQNPAEIRANFDLSKGPFINLHIPEKLLNQSVDGSSIQEGSELLNRPQTGGFCKSNCSCFSASSRCWHLAASTCVNQLHSTEVNNNWHQLRIWLLVWFKNSLKKENLQKDCPIPHVHFPLGVGLNKIFFFLFNLALVIFNSSIMNSHLLQHLPSSWSQPAFQASRGITENTDRVLCTEQGWSHLWIQHRGCSAHMEVSPQTQQIIKGTETIQLQHRKSKPQPFAQGNNPSSSFKSSLELARRWTWCFYSLAGCYDHTLWPYMQSTRPDYHMYCWGKANMNDLWERKSSLIIPTVTNQVSAGTSPSL